MKKIIATLLIMTFFIITANAQRGAARIRIKTERRVHRMELRRIHRIERRRRHRRIAVELNTSSSQKLQAILYKAEGDKFRSKLA